MRQFALLFCCLIVLPVLASAQSSDRLDLFAGYSYISQDISLRNLTNNSGVSGWNASLTLPIRSAFGVVADVSGFYPSSNSGCGSQCTSSARIHTFMVGPQINFGSGKVKPFVRLLVGDTNMYTANSGTESYTFTSNNAVTFGLGGGVDYNLTHRFGLRGQVDWLHNGFKTTNSQLAIDEVHNVARISTGVVVRF